MSKKNSVEIDKIRFVVTSRIKRKFGVSIETNSSEVARFIGKATRFPTLPDGTPAGKLVAEIIINGAATYASLGDYIVKLSCGNFAVKSGE